MIKPKWLHQFLRYISILEKRLNHAIYRIDVPGIIDYYKEDGSSISQKTAYKYVNYAKVNDYIRESTTTVKKGTLYTKESLQSLDAPICYLLDLEGEEVSPDKMPDKIIVLDGEKTLKSYLLTEKAIELITNINTNRSPNNKR